MVLLDQKPKLILFTQTQRTTPFRRRDIPLGDKIYLITSKRNRIS